MAYLCKFILPAALIITLAGQALAVELPSPAALSAKYNLSGRKITVVEPHASTNERRTLTNYTALPVDALLTHWFGEHWLSESAEIDFFAKDGYRSVIAGSKLKQYRAFLAFARTDGAPFAVDNIGQNEKQIALGPYYLIWDNLGAPELLHQGAYGWPYQVTAIELHSKTEDRALHPRSVAKNLEQGLEETREYCLTCHNIRGIGGKKYPLDLLRAACRWQDADLQAWIDSPSRLKPGTTMPALGRMLPARERRQIIERIVDYLKAMKAETPGSCATK